MGYSKTILSAVAAVSLILLAGESLAKGKPKGAKATDPQQIAQLFSGKTSNWSRGSTFYWAPNGVMHGVGKSGDSIGIGKWFVTNKGKLCNETTWYWPENGQTKSDLYEECWEFVTAPDGTIWERYLPEKSDWFKHKHEKQVKGDTQKSKFNKIKKDLGL